MGQTKWVQNFGPVRCPAIWFVSFVPFRVDPYFEIRYFRTGPVTDRLNWSVLSPVRIFHNRYFGPEIVPGYMVQVQKQFFCHVFKGMIFQGSDFFGPVRGPDFLIPVRSPDFLRSFKFKNIFFLSRVERDDL